MLSMMGWLLGMNSKMIGFMGAPLFETVVRGQFSHCAAPTLSPESCNPHHHSGPRAGSLMSPDSAARRQVCGFMRVGVVGCFLHASSLYFFG
jgi:hypothetical protein